MRLKIINPNTTLSMTAKIEDAARSVASPGTEILAVSPAMGPASIEGPYDEAFCVPGLIEEVRKGDRDGFDAFVIACFDDPGLAAARSITARPVIGIAEAAMHVASMVASSFTIITTLSRAIPVMEHLAVAYGFERHCRAVRAIDMEVLALEEPGSPAREKLLAAIASARCEDRCEAVLLGCAGMADLARDLTRATGLPVIDGVAAATKIAEALVGLGVMTGKTGLYATPLAKPFAGMLEGFAMPGARH